MKKISVFDADACIMMGKPLSNGKSLLSEVVGYFDDNYIHKFVYDEVKTRGAKTHLQSLENQKLIETLDDVILLDMLYNGIGNNEVATCNYFRQSLLANINLMKPKEKLELTNQYSIILGKTYNNRTDLIFDLNNIENGLPYKTSAGELKTAILVDILHFLDLAEINFFISNDLRARLLIHDSSSGRISTNSPIGTFFLLRDQGMKRIDALPYLDKLGGNHEINALNKNNKRIVTTHQQIFDDIFDPSVGVYLIATGQIHY